MRDREGLAAIDAFAVPPTREDHVLAGLQDLQKIGHGPPIRVQQCLQILDLLVLLHRVWQRYEVAVPTASSRDRKVFTY